MNANDAGTVTRRVALDARALDGLKAQAKAAPDKALRQAAGQFETVFMDMLMKSMRATLAQKGVAFPAEAKVQTDRFQIELQPYEGIELKYVLDQGAPMLFSWSATAPVNVDMHSLPFDGGTEATESFVIEDLPAQTALYVAPFNGIHGWYWQNRTMSPVTLTLDTTGAMSGSKLFDPAGEHDRPLAPPTAPTAEPAAVPTP